MVQLGPLQGMKQDLMDIKRGVVSWCKVEETDEIH
jgi:hypothetical protein